MNKFGLSKSEERVLQKLNTPAKIQDYLCSLKVNPEKNGETCLSPRRVLREQHAHCMEGAMLAALALWIHGEKPLVMDLKTGNGDDDHILTLFRYKNHWGAITKTNHAVLRYRDPIYKTLRELALSYFHEYFLDNGRKTLRSYSDPFDFSKLKDKTWVTSEKDLWYIPRAIDKSPHHALLTKDQIKKLRKADPIERKVGEVVEWQG